MKAAIRRMAVIVPAMLCGHASRLAVEGAVPSWLGWCWFAAFCAFLLCLNWVLED